MVSLAHPSFGLELIFHKLPTTEFAVLSKNNVTKDYKTKRVLEVRIIFFDLDDGSSTAYCV